MQVKTKGRIITFLKDTVRGAEKDQDVKTILKMKA